MELLRLKEVLNEKGIESKDLAVLIGVTPTTISNINKGNTFPKPETLKQIAEVLDVDIRDLFYSTKKSEMETIYKKDENGKEIVIGFLKK
ncbi:helix-turn-helix domain-containing protein [Chryseobacterium indoltheticum]|uniref:DNA-binding transcriptional regulator, XRE-family HTH domain n=1 Tax=Chryseobacterium indoltheticum TaxID=254 RepID=A0A381FHJ0_9FLAO|nr:helix-turn-helix transcriptional regulator [Chryseobacterium indoltheticum]AZA74768.1 XRE family transcriptional regulator [Chryseobacterium indoltheticum]SIQ35988.1 DNA-binding transcriptional regulator, XRE-family HTH domain [Chryseobacterium indoltheticum]SUX45994.1 Predicted transcriptional regulator [Chryseobacterium indoltheticum]